jgi:hypothetical protein
MKQNIGNTYLVGFLILVLAMGGIFSLYSEFI